MSGCAVVVGVEHREVVTRTEVACDSWRWEWKQFLGVVEIETAHVLPPIL